MKKILSFILAASMVFMLAACGSGQSAGSMAAYPVDAAYPSPAEEDWRDVPLDPEEEYDDSPESPFKNVATSPLSTFSSDVDTASYSNMRRFITNGQKPEGTRIEELVNYFDYEYPRPAPDAEHPFSITTEVAPCPWNEQHQLAMVGIQGAELQNKGDMANNIVFLLDVSGSMNEPNKLPLLQQSFKLLLENLSENDVVSIVTYAGSDRIIADSVPGSEQSKLRRLIDDLQAGGSTAGARGLQTAYALAEKNLIASGNNRIILATDGDFNVGPSSDAAMIDLVEQNRDKGIFISVLGFGMYNLKDSKMESIADHGNGNYAYIDTIEEARKVLVHEFDSTMFTIAKDLKIQVEFNPEVVAQYRLIGYNNRRLEDEDFNDDQKDAGDVGAGHSVTAFYELVLVGAEEQTDVDEPIYQKPVTTGSTDYMTVKVRYKDPDGTVSKLVQQAVPATAFSEKLSRNMGFASAVAEFGLILTESRYKANSSVSAVLARAEEYKGEDAYGLRAEFAGLVEQYRMLN